MTVTATSGSPQLVAGLSVTYASPDATGILVFAPVANQSGTGLITVTVRDDGGTANGGVDLIQRTFQITVHPVNDAPFLADPIAPIEVVVNSVLTVVGLDGYFGDADTATSGDLLEYAVTVNPPVPDDPDYDPDLLVARIVDRALNLQYAPGRTGHVDVTVRASDQAGTWAETTVRVTVTLPGNSAPVVADPIADILVEAGQPDPVFDLSEVFADADVVAGTDSLAYSVTNTAPALLTETLSSSLLTLSLIPGKLGTAELTVRVTDNQGAYAETSFAVTVVPFNNPPAATSIPPVVVDEDAADVVLSLRDFFSDAEDPDEDLVLEVALAASSELNPVVFDLNPNTGVFTLALVADGYGNAEYTVTARDMGGKAVATSLSVTVNAVNDAPTGPETPVELPLNPSPGETVIDLWDYFYDVEDGWDLTYEIVAGSVTNSAIFGGPPAIDGDDYLWLDAAADASGTSDLTIRATDADGAAVLGIFTFGPATGGDGDPSPDPGPQPVVSIVDVKHTGETAAAGYFLVQRQDNSSATVTVGYELAGDAQHGVDYSSGAANGTLTLGPHEAVTITIVANNNSVIDGPRTVTLNLVVPDGSNVGLGTASKELFVNDDDGGAVVYVAHAKSTWEGATGDDEGAFVLEAIGSLSFDFDPMYSGYTGPVPPPGGFTWSGYGTAVGLTTLQVPYQITGSASGADYTGPVGSGSVTITSPGSVSIPIIALPDEVPDEGEEVLCNCC